MARRKKPKPRHVPVIGERVMTPEGPGRAMEVNRPNGIIGATIRLEDRTLLKSPGGGMKWFACRDLKPIGKGDDADQERGGRVIAKGARKPTYVCVVTLGTKHSGEYDFGIHAPGCECEDRRRAKLAHCDIYPRYEGSPAAAAAAERQTLRLSGYNEDDVKALRFKIFECAKRAHRASQRAARKAATAVEASAKSPDLQGETSSLQTAKPSGRLRGSRKPTHTSTTRRTTMAKTATKGRSKSRKTAEVEETNGSNRMTHAEKVKLVPQFVKRLKAGETFSELIASEDFPRSGMRRALADAGYDTKGQKLEEIPDYSELEGKALAKAVAGLREDGKPWYFISLATDASKAELVEVLEENGYGHLASGRVSSASEEEAEAKPKSRKRGAAKAETATKTKSTKRGRAKAASEDEDEGEDEAPARKRGRGRRRSNPS